MPVSMSTSKPIHKLHQDDSQTALHVNGCFKPLFFSAQIRFELITYPFKIDFEPASVFGFPYESTKL